MSNQSQSRSYEIAIIGAGLSGVGIASELMEQLDQPANITFIEWEPGRKGGGVAYGKTSADPWHQTNSGAIRIVQAASGKGHEIFSQLDIPANQVMNRHAVGTLALRRLFNAASNGKGHKIRWHYDLAVGINDNKDGPLVTVQTESGEDIVADRAILATGNNDVRELPLARKLAQENTAFNSRYVSNQWTPDGRKKMITTPADEDVLIIGTALSGYDAARSYLKRGHKGKITLMSRRGLEHYQFPELLDEPKSFKLPKPRFLAFLDEPARAVKELVAEFYELTGVEVDLEKGTVGPEGWGTNFVKPSTYHQPALVLWDWEKYIPQVLEKIGVEQFGKAIREQSSLINIFRMGAGFPVYEEIKAAKASGQLSVIAASIDPHEGFKANQNGVAVQFKHTHTGQAETKTFGRIISSLGPDHDFTKTASQIWRDAISKGYTSPHRIGLGIEIDHSKGSGALPGSDHIYAVGAPVVGDIMVTNGMLGSPAYSAFVLSLVTKKTSQTVISSLKNQREFPKPSL